jgi:hypothetical protein
MNLIAKELVKIAKLLCANYPKSTATLVKNPMGKDALIINYISGFNDLDVDRNKIRELTNKLKLLFDYVNFGHFDSDFTLKISVFNENQDISASPNFDKLLHALKRYDIKLI